jgi:hypothetical protein
MNGGTMNSMKGWNSGFATILTIQRWVYGVECIVVEDGVHQLYLEHRRGQSKEIKQT